METIEFGKNKGVIFLRKWVLLGMPKTFKVGAPKIDLSIAEHQTTPKLDQMTPKSTKQQSNKGKN